MLDPRASAEVELARRCAAGDPEAWRELVARYGALLAALARRMLTRVSSVVSDSDVDEVVAEVFLALLRRERLLLRRFDPAYRFSTYLGVICRSEVGRWARRRGRIRPGALPIEDQAPAASEPGPAEGPLREERAAALVTLRRALDALPARDRLLLTLRYLEGLDYRAIAKALGLSPDSVGQLLHRAKERLALRLPQLRHLVEGS